MKIFYKSVLFISCAFLAAIIFFGGQPQEANAWGFWAHKRINRLAVFTLPPEMITFYKEHLEYITEHAVDPDKRRYAVEGEDKNHYIDIDYYGGYPFDMLPRKWEDAIEKYSEDTIREYGILPWNLEWTFDKLVRAFKKGDTKQILKYSADFGHYIGDGHVPLHTTLNYNGQLTGQKGIHGFWESRIPESFGDDYDYFVGKACYVDDVNEFFWEFILDSHTSVDTVLRFERLLNAEFPSDQKYSFEKRGASTMKVYSADYTAAYNKMMNGMVERRMRAAVIDMGCLWYSAWMQAGQPDLTNLGIVEWSEEEIEEQKALDAAHQGGKIKGREHED